jgi:hypothetical protein
VERERVKESYVKVDLRVWKQLKEEEAKEATVATTAFSSDQN